MTGNDRFKRNHDDDVTTHTGDDLSDDAFRSFAYWVNEPVSAYSKHHVPEDLREAIHAVDDPYERQRLRAVVEAYERSELSPRDFVRLIAESDHVDFFDPLSTPEGWGSKPEDWQAPRRSDDGFVEGDGLARVHEGEAIVPTDDPGFDARPDLPDTPAGYPWAEVLIGLLIVACIVVVVFVI